jgi:hypothetical protein
MTAVAVGETVPGSSTPSLVELALVRSESAALISPRWVALEQEIDSRAINTASHILYVAGMVATKQGGRSMTGYHPLKIDLREHRSDIQRLLEVANRIGAQTVELVQRGWESTITVVPELTKDTRTGHEYFAWYTSFFFVTWE